MRLLKALLIWFLILGLAFLNGGVRELLLVPILGAPYALVLSGILLSACILAMSAATLPWLGLTSNQQAFGIGGFWLLLTLVFELGFGRLVQHKPWRELLDAYAFKDGNIWLIVLLLIVLAPLIARRIRRKNSSG